jgi:nucleotide-binding universal stress UspA family protein
MERQILVPLDGSSLAEAVLPHATQLAQATLSNLHLLRVVIPPTVTPSLAWPMPAPINTERWLEAERSAARTYLDTIAAMLAKEGITARTTVLEGDPATTIIEFAQENANIREIAMASHGRSGFNRWIMGSVAERVLHSTPVPLLVVRADEHDIAVELKQPRREFKLETPYKNILVPLDGSDFAEQALGLARMIADHYQATLFLVSVVPFLDDVGLAEGGVVPLWGVSDQQTARTYAAEYLTSTAADLTDAGLNVRTRWVDGPPAETITAIASEEHADLIVMSTHGRSGISRLWLGSVAARVIRRADQPILLVRAQEEKRERGK